jgi:hypothetical protein
MRLEPVREGYPLLLQQRTQFDRIPLGSSARADQRVAVRDVPDSFDGREEWPGCIHAVLDQGQCGSCWAFAASETLSDRLCIASGGVVNVTLSPGDLLGCEKLNLGCTCGSLPEWAWAFLESTGIPTADCVPYTSGSGDTQKCPADHKCADGTPITTLYRAANYTQCGSTLSPEKHVEAIQQCLLDGPVDATFNVYADFDDAAGRGQVRIVFVAMSWSLVIITVVLSILITHQQPAAAASSQLRRRRRQQQQQQQLGNGRCHSAVNNTLFCAFRLLRDGSTAKMSLCRGLSGLIGIIVARNARVHVPRCLRCQAIIHTRRFSSACNRSPGLCFSTNAPPPCRCTRRARIRSSKVCTPSKWSGGGSSTGRTTGPCRTGAARHDKRRRCVRAQIMRGSHKSTRVRTGDKERGGRGCRNCSSSSSSTTTTTTSCCRHSSSYSS